MDGSSYYSQIIYSRVLLDTNFGQVSISNIGLKIPNSVEMAGRMQITAAFKHDVSKKCNSSSYRPNQAKHRPVLIQEIQKLLPIRLSTIRSLGCIARVFPSLDRGIVYSTLKGLDSAVDRFYP